MRTPGRIASRDLRTLFHAGAVGDMTDRQLLDRFLTRRDEGGETAFVALVERHGPMVLRTSRGILGDDHEAMDAFQATFLVLARKAGSLWVRDSLGPWLHRVACRAAGRAKAHGDRRRATERRAVEVKVDTDRDDRAAALHEEIDRLPERYRVPIVLCDLEGRTCEEVARHLGRPVATVKSWRARARERLRDRLTRRGLAPAQAISVAPLSGWAAHASLPAGVVNSTARAAVDFAGSKALAAGVVPVAAVVLTEGMIKTMYLTKVKMAGAALLALGVAVAGAGTLEFPASGNKTGIDRAEEGASQVEAAPDPASRPGDPAQRAADLTEQLRVEIDLLTAQLEARQAELRREEARLKVATTVVATSLRLRAREKNIVSASEMQKVEGEAEVAAAQVAIAKAEIRESEIRLDQARRMQDHPEQVKEYLDRAGTARSSAVQERRLGEMEQKLDQILKVLEGTRRVEAR